MAKPKLKNNWREMTLEYLENESWGEPNYDSYLVRRSHEIRRLPLIELTNDDVAMMLRQRFSLDYIIPLAFDRLQQDVLAFGHSGLPGAIMDSLLQIPKEYWHLNTDYWFTTKEILENNTNEAFFERTAFDDAAPSFRT